MLKTKLLATFVAFLLTVQLASSRNVESSSGNVRLKPHHIDNALDIIISWGDTTVLDGLLGLSLPQAVGTATSCDSSEPGVTCTQWGDFAQVLITQATPANDYCARIEWTSTQARRLEDCYDLESGRHWYGSGETFRQYWPIEQEKRAEGPFVTADFLQDNDNMYGGVVESYWLTSTGVAIHVDEDVPLFVSVNTSHSNHICYVAQDRHPYTTRNELSLKYSICLGENLKAVHQRSISKFYSKPTEIPDEGMLLYPFWSTWAQYKEDVNQSIVLEFSQRVKDEGYTLSSHIEIDDHWETCYGEAVFNPDKFSDPAGMVQEIKNMGFGVTVWIHPFINFDCPSFTTGVQNSYFVKDQRDKAGITWWWQGINSGAIDFTNPAAVEWWSARLRRLQTEVGIDSFKFDAGETNWMPHSLKLSGNQDLQPNSYTTTYVDAVSGFGKLIEVRSAHRNQGQPIFVRMLDKDSRWGYNNGLKSLIPTLLHFGIIGYPFVLPDMIGGNAYGERPSRELYIRWMEANIFMPSVQFSIVPWNYDAEVIKITQDILALREQYKDEILGAARQALVDGSPMNRPMWWVDPTDQITHDIDSPNWAGYQIFVLSSKEGGGGKPLGKVHLLYSPGWANLNWVFCNTLVKEYMLGDTILVAPVLDEGATRRDIYLPTGNWVGGLDTIVYRGPTWLQDYSAPIDVVPYFVKMDLKD